MSLWEFAAAVAGHNRAHGDDTPQPITESDFDAMLERHEEIIDQVYGGKAP